MALDFKLNATDAGFNQTGGNLVTLQTISVSGGTPLVQCGWVQSFGGEGYPDTGHYWVADFNPQSADVYSNLGITSNGADVAIWNFPFMSVLAYIQLKGYQGLRTVTTRTVLVDTAADYNTILRVMPPPSPAEYDPVSGARWYENITCVLPIISTAS